MKVSLSSLNTLLEQVEPEALEPRRRLGLGQALGRRRHGVPDVRLLLLLAAQGLLLVAEQGLALGLGHGGRRAPRDSQLPRE